MYLKSQSAQISLALLIASAITSGMLVLALVLLGQSFHGMESAKVSAASATARQLAVSVDDRINAITAPPSTALAVLSHDPLATSQTDDERIERIDVLADILQSSDIVSAVYAGWSDGDFFLLRKVRSSGALQFPDAPDGTHYLLQSVTREAGSVTGEWQFYDAGMKLIGRREVPDYTFDPRTRPWFEAAADSPKTELSTPYVFFTTHETGLTLSRRSSGFDSGAGSAVFGIDVTVTDLSSHLNQLRQTPGTRIAIVNQQGQVLADSSGRTEAGNIVSTVLDQGGQPVAGAAVRLFNAEDRNWYGIREPLNALADEQLQVAVAIPSDELLADVWAALTRQTLIAGGIGVALLVVAWFLGRRVGRPLERLTEQVGRLSRFRFDTQVRSDSHIREAHQLGVALDDMSSTIRSFQNIASVLNRGQDLNQLLQDILEQIVHIVGQERGGIYLFSKQEQELRLAVDQHSELPDRIENINTSIDDSDLIRELRQHIGGHPVFAILRNRRKKLVGVLVIEMEHGEHTHLSDDLIVFVDEIAGSAAVAIETRELLESQQALLEGIIRLVANAIDAKSPYTGGHCERVPKLAQMILAEAEASNEGRFAGFSMSDDERHEFELAAWLHDCGKITSPEYVVDKAVKLETLHNRIHEIRTRFEVLHRDAEIACLQAVLDGGDESVARQQRDHVQSRLQEEFAFLARANRGGESMSDEDIERIRAIGQQTWQRHFSDRLGLSSDEQRRLDDVPEPDLPAEEHLLADKPGHLQPWGDHRPPVEKDDPRNVWGFDMELPEYAYNRGEIHNLTVAKGTLTDEERFKINEHIVQTICMLDALPLPDRLANVPRLAGTHHERMDGQGYPCGLTAEQMGIPERIMAVADVFEALTAVDRPYKEGKTLTQALTIMSGMVDNGHIDRETFELFVCSGTYLRYGEQHLRPEQIDQVDESQFMNRN
ncbi:HD domain-containing phosphohydrolase [Marinobacter pelagius]|uniref:HD-GYP domain, c-di-GMP phosphodiesterase class II (Or its inactivated variant) n=1 Tax=Marinobacter pelagius TaxID=379482 RepID=A0A1I4XST3_9GAMM|nr:HD domain-containing phosphohydrolase [Marinobacter pelagius]SFN28847.1 HD-GYP domain, c-di-GMP phosphodiesterase class II (or its inactivated variant) [Marinobacter pelagius]